MNVSMTAEEAARLLTEHDGEVSNSDTSEPEEEITEQDELSNDSDEFGSTDDSNSSNPSVILSKNKKVMFATSPYPTSRYTVANIFRGKPGLKNIGKLTEPGQFFKLFIDPQMVEKCVQHTNEYALSVKDDFKQVDIPEIYKFIGLKIFIGVFTAKQENLEEMWSREFRRAFVYRSMSKNRFKEIKRFIRFDNRQRRVLSTNRARLDPIRDFWQAFLNNCKLRYNPESNITIDEMMIPFRGRCSFKMYLPAKPCKYGLKIFAAVELESKYFYTARLYEGKVANRPETNQAFNVCKELMEPLLKKGYNLCTDNFYTSFQLAEYLLANKTTLVGTLRKNKAEIPPELNSAGRRSPGDAKYAYQRDMTLLSYVTKPTKYVMLLSTLHTGTQQMVDDLPEMIADYNRMKVGVDVLDQKIGYYTAKRGTNRWPLAVFDHTVDLAGHNAFILYSKQFPNDFKERKQFLIQLSKDLVEWDQGEPRIEPPAKVSLSNARGRCKSCPWRSDKKTSLVCGKCSKFCCKDHVVHICQSCFQLE